MIRLEIGNSYSRITGLSPVQEKKLRSDLSYTVGGSAAFFSGYGVRKKSLLDKKGYFPTGLTHRLKSFVMTVVDNRKVPEYKATHSQDGAYLWQCNALTNAVIHGRGIITAPTGTGKSRVISMISQYYGLKTLVVVPSLEIKKQLKLTMPQNVTVENIDSKALNSLSGFDVLIIDEGHHVAAKTYQTLNKTAWKDIYYRFYLSATPFRNDDEEKLLFESIAGEVIYKLDYQSAIKERYIVPVEAYYLDMPKQPVRGYTYQEVYAEMVVHNDERNQQIGTLLTDLYNSGKSTLCLVKEIRHGKILQERLGAHIPFISGEDVTSREYIKLFSEGKVKVIIATTAMLGEGIDTKACEFVIIAGGGKAKSQFMQQVGRAVRTYPGKESAKVILMKDSSHRYLLRHYNAQKQILLEEYGVKIEELKIV